MSVTAKTAKTAKRGILAPTAKTATPYRGGGILAVNREGGTARSDFGSKCRITRRSLMLVLIFAAMKCCHRSLRWLADKADRLEGRQT